MTIHQLPPRYRIAWTDGEREEFVEDFETRKLWEAETMLFFMCEQHPELHFWIDEGKKE